MELNISQCKNDPDVKIVAMSGRLGIEASEKVLSLLLQAIEESKDSVILDMADVDFISSAGLRVILTAYKKALALGKNIASIKLQPQVYKIFKIAGFDAFNFNICKNEKESLKLFKNTIKQKT